MELITSTIRNYIVSFIIIGFSSFSYAYTTVSYLNDDSENHKLDVYFHSNKSNSILILPAGGFVMTDKADYEEKAERYFNLGYNVFVPNYSDVIFSEVCNNTHKTWYKPVQEVNAALGYIEANYKISSITLLGESAGAIVALNLAYLAKGSKLYSGPAARTFVAKKAKARNNNTPRTVTPVF